MKRILFILFFLLLCIGCTAQASTTSPATQGQTNSSTPVAIPPSGEISLDRNYYLVIDDSGSMGDHVYCGTFPNKLEAAKWAITEFITKTVPPEVNVGLYALNNGHELVALGKNNHDVIIAKTKALSPTDGTPLNYAIRTATDVLAKQRNKQLGYGEYYIVVATDGAGTDGDVGVSVDYANKNHVPIITIGFGITNHPLSTYSLSYREATNPQELLQALNETQGESAYYDSTVFKK
jgi:hypothetical protein